MSAAANDVFATPQLVGDIGATNARFGLIDRAGELVSQRSYACADFPTLLSAIEAFQQEASAGISRKGALAVASPVAGDYVAMTNHPWRFSIRELQSQLGYDELTVINDFTALALALPELREADRQAVGGGVAVAGTPIGVLGPGSGLGVSGLIPAGKRWTPLTGEGGHSTMPPATSRESAVLDLLRRRFDHVSAERLLSGPGLVNLYNALCEIDDLRASDRTAAQITDATMRAEDPHCAEATAMFCTMLGTVAANLALTLGARGGIYIAGGIVPRLGRDFNESGFRARFEAKGRFETYLAAIPTYVVTHKLPAFLGCARVLREGLS